MGRLRGYAIIVDPEAPTQEWDTANCSHCQRIIRVKPFASPKETNAWCYSCNGVLCAECGPKMDCDVVEKKLERVEATQDFSRWFKEACR